MEQPTWKKLGRWPISEAESGTVGTWGFLAFFFYLSTEGLESGMPS